MTISRFWPFLFLTAGFATSCKSPLDVERDTEPLLQTERLQYKLGPDGRAGLMKTEIPYTFVNRTGVRIVRLNCNGRIPALLERKQGSKWVTGWIPVHNDCPGPPIVIEAGEVYRGTLHVWAAEFGSDTSPQFAFERVEGIYRIRWEDALRSEFPDQEPLGEELPLEVRISNSFVLKGSF